MNRHIYTKGIDKVFHYTMFQKTKPLNFRQKLCQILTDFKNSRLSWKFARREISMTQRAMVALGNRPTSSKVS